MCVKSAACRDLSLAISFSVVQTHTRHTSAFGGKTANLQTHPKFINMCGHRNENKPAKNGAIKQQNLSAEQHVRAGSGRLGAVSARVTLAGTGSGGFFGLGNSVRKKVVKITELFCQICDTMIQVKI